MHFPQLPAKKLNARGISHIAIPLAVIAVLAVGATFVSVANKSSNSTASLSSATAANTPKPKSYVLIYSQSDKGRFNYVNIKLNGTTVAHKCGKKLSGDVSVTKKLPDGKPLKVSCAPVGDGGSYEVTFLRSKTVTANSPSVPVDTTDGFCTLVFRDASKIRKVPIGSDGKCQSAPDDDKATQVASTMRVLPKLDKGNKSFKGYVEIAAEESLSKTQCNGVVSVKVEGKSKAAYDLPLKYTKAKTGERKGAGYCVAKLKKYKIAPGEDVAVSATYAGSPYLAAGSASAKISIPKSTP